MATSLSKNGGTIRTFVAVELSLEARRQLVGVQTSLQSHGPSLKFVAPEAMHMTLRFLGGLPPERVAVVQVAAAAAARCIPPFTLQFSHLGSFPGGERVPRVIWVGLEQNAGYIALQNLFESLQNELQAQGFSRESKEFAPHLTTARVREGQSFVDVRSLTNTVQRLSNENILNASFPVRRLTVFKSVLSGSGPRYTALSRPALGSEDESSRRRTASHASPSSGPNG